jgi:hypothetical protein
MDGSFSLAFQNIINVTFGAIAKAGKVTNSYVLVDHKYSEYFRDQGSAAHFSLSVLVVPILNLLTY